MGKRSYFLYYRTRDRRQRRPKIGDHGALTCDQARVIAQSWLWEVSQGKDPSAEKKEKRLNPTLKELSVQYMKEHGPRKKASSLKEDKRLWELHILPILGSLKVSSIERTDIARLHNSLQHVSITANRVRSLLSKALNLAELWGYRPNHSNPCLHVKKYTEQKRERFLNQDEIARLMNALKEEERDSMNHQIQAMYYFPNNQYNYRALQLELKIKKGMADLIAGIFKLKPAFHKLLWPAIIHDVRSKDANLARQLAQEEQGESVVNALIDGMSIIDLDDEEEVISSLASDVIHQADVDVSNVLDIEESKVEALNRGQANPTALNQSFNALGQFLVDYAMKNALKSEMLTTHSRIMFANIITDFIECHHQVSDQALERVDKAFKDIYDVTLKELWKIKGKMNLRDIIYFANLYQKLSSPFIHDAFLNGYEVLDRMFFETNVIMLITILKDIHDTPRKETPDKSQMQNLVSLFLGAQENLSYIVCNGYPFSELQAQSRFLKSAKDQVKQWDSLSSASSGSFQTSPNSGTSFRKADNLNKILISYLGTRSSHIYENDEEDTDDESLEENGDTEEESD